LKKLTLGKLLLTLCLGGPGVQGAALAQDKSAEIEALERFFTAETIDPGWFAQVFLDQVPAAQLMPVRQQVTAGLGAFKGAEKDAEGPGYRAVFEKGHIPATISLDGEGKINGLFLRPPVPGVSSVEDALEQFAALGDKDAEGAGQLALLLTRNGETLHALNAEQPLAIGSSFKLSILAALQAAVAQGETDWASVYRLQAKDQSLPSGTLQRWPVGAPLTLYALAARMISESDNTATDALLHALGREAVEAQAPERNRPFLTTREAFVLKNPENASLTDRYLAAAMTEKYALLEQAADHPLPGVAVFDGSTTVRPEVEWFYSAQELCALMAQVAALDLVQINDAGIASAGEWASVAYKGGSEPGVLNQTFQLTDQAGNRYCLSATRNAAQPFENGPFFTAINGLLSALASR